MTKGSTFKCRCLIHCNVKETELEVGKYNNCRCSALLLHGVTSKSNFGLVLADDEMFSFVIRGFFISTDAAACLP